MNYSLVESKDFWRHLWERAWISGKTVPIEVSSHPKSINNE